MKLLILTIYLTSCGEQVQQTKDEESSSTEEALTKVDKEPDTVGQQDVTPNPVEELTPKDPDFHEGCNHHTPCSEQPPASLTMLDTNKFYLTRITYQLTIKNPMLTTFKIAACLQENLTDAEKTEFDTHLETTFKLFEDYKQISNLHSTINYSLEDPTPEERMQGEKIKQHYYQYSRKIYPYMCYFERMRRKYCNELQPEFSRKINRATWLWDKDDWLEPIDYAEIDIPEGVTIWLPNITNLTLEKVPLVFAYYGVKC